MSGDEDEENKPVSFSSLRSKFENLAAANANQPGPSNYRKTPVGGGNAIKNQVDFGVASRSRAGSAATPPKVSRHLSIVKAN
jgi:hypothetical protein